MLIAFEADLESSRWLVLMIKGRPLTTINPIARKSVKVNELTVGVAPIDLGLIDIINPGFATDAQECRNAMTHALVILLCFFSTFLRIEILSSISD